MIKKTLLACSVGLLLWGCYPAGPDYVEDLDVTYTTHDNKYDFAGKATYAMPDKIVVDVDIKDGDTTYVYMKDVFATPILQAIDKNMQALGWTKKDISEKPDLLLTPGGITSTTYFYSYWYDWWYGGWYGGWYGWYYPPYYTVSSYTTGTLVMTLADPNIETPILQSQTVWVAACNGVMAGTYDVSRVTKGINDAFAQSAYLKTN